MYMYRKNAYTATLVYSCKGSPLYLYSSWYMTTPHPPPSAMTGMSRSMRSLKTEVEPPPPPNM